MNTLERPDLIEPILKSINQGHTLIAVNECHEIIGFIINTIMSFNVMYVKNVFKRN